MEVKIEPVVQKCIEKKEPPYEDYFDEPIVKPEPLQTFEGMVTRIKSEFKTNIKQPAFKEEFAHGEYEGDCKPFKIEYEAYSNTSELKKQIPATHESPSHRPLLNCSRKTSSVSFDDIKSDKINIKEDFLGHRPIVVVINLEKRLFYSRNFVCSVCMELFEAFDSLSLHKHVKHRAIVTFDTNKRMEYSGNENQSNLRLFDSLNPDKRLYECGQCNFKSSMRSNLKIHKRCHNGEKPFVCDQCDYKSTRISNLKAHKLSHTGEKSFKCIKCNYKSAILSNFKRHKLSHTGDKPFKCDQCGYKCAQKSSLKIHSLSHSNDKPYKCDRCVYKSATRSTMKKHKLLHTGMKPFNCDQCSYKSATRSTLQKHKLSHDDAKPFECDQCVDKFSRRSNLKTHQLLHTGEKPFGCDQCNNKYRQKSHLRNHKRLHTGEK